MNDSTNELNLESHAPPILRVGITVLLGFLFIVAMQIGAAAAGTEIGWGGGMAVGKQTFKTGATVGAILSYIAFFPVLILRWNRFRQEAASIWVSCFVVALLLFPATALITLFRAGMSFFMYLEP